MLVEGRGSNGSRKGWLIGFEAKGHPSCLRETISVSIACSLLLTCILMGLLSKSLLVRTFQSVLPSSDVRSGGVNSCPSIILAALVGSVVAVRTLSTFSQTNRIASTTHRSTGVCC